MNKLEEIEIVKVNRGDRENLTDTVITEFPLTIFLNDEEIVTLLCTPDKMDYLAIGFLQSEGLITDKSELKKVKIDQEKGVVEVVTKEKTSSLVEELYGKRTITSGCGKGTIFYNAVDSLKCEKIEIELEVSTNQALKLIKKLQEKAELFKKTGGSHSSALCNLEDILIFNEDIGRHNAVDKIVGEAVIKGLVLTDKLLVSSGRISSEILLKVAKLRLPILISRAAPTSLTVEMAEQLGITLIGFARGKRMNIYSHAWRVK